MTATLTEGGCHDLCVSGCVDLCRMEGRLGADEKDEEILKNCDWDCDGDNFVFHER